MEVGFWWHHQPLRRAERIRRKKEKKTAAVIKKKQCGNNAIARRPRSLCHGALGGTWDLIMPFFMCRCERTCAPNTGMYTHHICAQAYTPSHYIYVTHRIPHNTQNPISHAHTFWRKHTLSLHCIRIRTVTLVRAPHTLHVCVCCTHGLYIRRICNGIT